ncbi:MAG: TetR family transcriptional regulator [Hyphomonas sp. 34-62-18]|jgi:AcrR family transcriptional regulator|nr:TetR/AcrR family transcriptional regulator [Hyphomonas sp. 34-62-18]OYW86781.1 MAG: TetR family transcriptional regulator [Hyphomonas sp. 32-62-5]OZB16598.1 MAG: TetR family transcriptional regulator [Hyphomonas sp. 34-62-18]
MSELLDNAPDMMDPATESEDGRKRRSERSREQIIEAMFELVAQGELDPGAARIAEVANVSLRTVFRHFEEVDGLYQEMNRRVKEEVMPIVKAPFNSTNWRDTVLELVQRRSEVFERIMPYRVCGSIRRFRSAYLMQGHQDFVTMERSILDSVLPEEVRTDVVLEAAFDSVLGFDTWRRLRQDRGLSVEEARAAVRKLVEALLASV